MKNNFTVENEDEFTNKIYVEDNINGSIGGNIKLPLNGTLAVSVIRVLSDPDVLEYLKK